MPKEISHEDVVIPDQFQDGGAFGPRERQDNIDRLLEALKVLNMDIETVSYTFMDFLVSTLANAAVSLAENEVQEQVIYEMISHKANLVLDALEKGDTGDEPMVIHMAAMSVAFHNILVAVLRENQQNGGV